MDLEKLWERALKTTQVIRARVMHLSSSDATSIPYIFLAESAINLGDTVLRRGKVLVHRPAIILPEDMPQFEGFEFQKDYQASPDIVKMFLLIRGVSFPSLKYQHQVSQIDIYEGHLEKAKEYFEDELQRREDAETGLIVGVEDSWQFSLLIYVGLLMSRSLPSDIRKLWEKFKDKGF